MPSDIKREDIEQKNDPSVARQYDDAPTETKLADFYSMVDGFKIGLLGSFRANVGPVTRSMAIAKRSGPDFLFLTNAHSQKVDELKERPEVCLSFQNSTSQDWISVTGKATVSSEDPRIKQVWNRGAAAWFGDVGDGKHDGSASDPRMTLIEVKPNYISYYKAESGALGYAKEVVVANITGGVANTGKLREIKENEISQARSKDGDLTS